MAALLERMFGKKADELRARMERSIVVTKKLIVQLGKTEKARQKETEAIKELAGAIKSWKSKLDEILHETRT